MSIIGDFKPFSELANPLSGETVFLFKLSLTDRRVSLASLIDPTVDDLDLNPSESLSDVSPAKLELSEFGEFS